jgi:carboxyl-terminal processing protease
MMRALVVAASFAALILISQPAAAQGNSETYRQLNLFGDIFERIRADYVDDVSDEDLIESAINGMLTSLDPHSRYLNAKTYQEMQVQTRGEFGGLGIEVTMENGFVRVITPMDGTPAHRAGILTDDIFTHIDGKPIQGLSLSEAVDLMRGPVNSDVIITVARQGEDQSFDVTITRAVITIQSVRSRAEGDAAYVRISSFSEQTTSGLERAIKTLREQIGDTMTGVILDLRNNPGGLLDQAVRVSDAFLEQGEIVSTRGRRDRDSQRFNARGGDIADGKPVVVLINGGSASASEIVAGALQDHGRAVILGTRSFGKGSVQTIIPLSGFGAIRLTTSLYYTPSGRTIQAKGIVPDIIVEQAQLEAVQGKRRRRNEADLPGHIVGEEEGENEEDVQAAAEDDRPFDFQLARAKDLLRGISLFGRKVVN